MTSLLTAIGRTPRTEALFSGAVSAPGLELKLPAMPVISRAFAPMVREGKYEASEMAIATFLMAKAAGKPLVLLPVILVSRFQEAALLCLAESRLTPDQLAGKRVGVRAYSQTTGLWLRGTLAESHGVAPESVEWITFEGAHVSEYQDPPWVTRAAPGKDLLAMLLAGEIDAAIFGNDLPEGVPLRPVFPDPEAAGAAFKARHGFVPVNHLLTARSDIAQTRPDALTALIALLGKAGATVTTRAAMRPALDLAMEYALAQGLLTRRLSVEEIWEGTPPSIR
ncbi:ABC transporter substrate-binding protein [Acetobacteraceae bacterium H6797]|nr:ABC transporter substrate-binding protein [Acetobacteraceae bacterium H6797]